MIRTWAVRRWGASPRTLRGLGIAGLGVCLLMLAAGCDGGAAVLAGDALGQVKTERTLRVATLNAPTTYFIGREGPAGYDYDLAAAFAEHLGVTLELVIAPDEAGVLTAVDVGEAQLGAAGLVMTEQRRAERRFVHYRETREVVVCRSGRSARAARRDLSSVVIDVAAGGSQMGAVRRLEDAGVLLNWRVLDAGSSDDVLMGVAEGRGACALAPRAAYALQRRYVAGLSSVAALPGGQRVGWAMTGGRGQRGARLAEEAEVWLRRPAVAALREALDEKYFGFRPEDIDSGHAATFLRAVETRLSSWRPLFEEAAARADVPWTLLAAVAYQESHWDPDAVSPTGVRGLLMLTNATARTLGVADRRDPVQSARGGARYLRQLRERLPDSIPEDDRWWFAAASYNVGYGHVLDARRLAQERQLDPDRWADVRQVLPLLEDPDVYPDTRYGYARGREAQTYVRRVRDYADILEKRFDALLIDAQLTGAPG